MITPEPLPPENPDDLGGWMTWGLPGEATVQRRNLVRQSLKAALISFPDVSLQVDAGARVILVTVWPASNLHGDIMNRIQQVLAPHAGPDLAVRLFVSEGTPWWIRGEWTS